MKKIKVAFIYHKNNIFLSGNHFDNTFYNFYIKALRRNENLEITNFMTDDVFDCSKLKGKFDIILLWENSPFGMPKELIGIKDIEIPLITKASDPVRAEESKSLHEKWNISYYFNFFHEDFFYELYPKHFKYRTVIFGLEPSLYQNVMPFNNRKKDKILLTGATANKGLGSKLLNFLHSSKWSASNFYRLRNLCRDLKMIDYTSTLDHEFINDLYPKLLEKYSAAITAASYSPCIKYWETTAAGCLTFMEITSKNRGNYIGFEDDVSSIFINEQNYKDKFHEFINDPNNPKWEKIAKNGREHALKNLNNDKATESLEIIMRELL